MKSITSSLCFLLFGATLATQPGLAQPADSQPEQSAEQAEAAPKAKPRNGRSSGRHDRVSIGNDTAVKEGETVHDLVVIGGSAVVDGTVTGDLVTILGNVKLGPKAEVKRDLVVIGGKLDADPGATLARERVVIGFDAASLLKRPWLRWPVEWFHKGLLYGRPLAHQLWWSWAVAGLALLLYVLIGLLFPRQLQACVTALEERPGHSLLAGALAHLLILPFLLLLVATGIGILILPFAIGAVLLAMMFGRAAVYRYAGQQLGTQTGLTFLQQPLVALLFGAILFCLLYAVPVVGMLLWVIVAPLALGAALLAVFKRSHTAAAQAAAPVALEPAADAVAGAVSTTRLALLPRVGFWMRFLATALDAMLVGLLVFAVLHRPKWFLLAWVTYHLVFWGWRGTTVGGIVCGLKIVRIDGQPINFAVALVRLLGSFFSLAVVGLGFFWAGWSSDKQSWHDKIAGTVIVKAPKGTALV